MSTDLSFFDERKEWSERKHIILSKYLKMASMMLGNVYYIDAFAGRGWYGGPSGEHIPGSPLRAAMLAQEFREEHRSYTLRCINIERDRELFEQLEAATAPYSDLVTNFNGEFVNTIDSILPLVGNDPVICFLDPFGVMGIDLSAIRRLLARRNAITDLWIRFDTGTIRRLDGLHDVSSPGAAKAFDILTRVYGIADTKKLHAALQGSSPDQRRKRAANLYMRVLVDEYTKIRGKGFACRYPIRTLDGEDKYYMLFAAGNRLPLLRTSDILYDAEEQYRADKQWYQEQTTRQMSLMGMIEPSQEDIFNEKVSQIQEEIVKAFSGKIASRDQINARLIFPPGEWFGRIKGPHLTAALKGLIEADKATASSTRISNGKTQFTFPS